MPRRRTAGSPRACPRRAGSARDRHLGHVGAALVEQPPHALVAVQVGELAEHAAAERDRVPAPVVVAAHRERRVAAAGEQRLHRLGRHAGLVAEHQHEHVAAWVHDAERRGDRRRAARAVGVVDHDLGTAQVHAPRTSSAEPPIATIVWSNPHARAVPTTWPSSVPSP